VTTQLQLINIIVIIIIFQGGSFRPHPSGDKGCQCTFIYSQAYFQGSTHNYISKFTELLEAATYLDVQIKRIRWVGPWHVGWTTEM